MKVTKSIITGSRSFKYVAACKSCLFCEKSIKYHDGTCCFSPSPLMHVAIAFRSSPKVTQTLVFVFILLPFQAVLPS